MPNYKQAPKLYHNKSSFNSKNYYNLPQELMDQIFQQLDGKCGNQIKLMTVLLGTLGDGSFGVSEKWICERTGMVQQTYSNARKALVERGWIYVEDGKLYVLPAIIRYGIHYPDGATEEERKAIKIATISKCVNDIKKQFDIETKAQYEIVEQEQYEIVPKAQYEIVYNKIRINKEEQNNNSLGLSSLRADNPKQSDNLKIEGEISRAQANLIVEPEWITPNLLLTSSGKYFSVKD